MEGGRLINKGASWKEGASCIKLLNCTGSAEVETYKIIDKVGKKQVFFVAKKV